MDKKILSKENLKVHNNELDNNMEDLRKCDTCKNMLNIKLFNKEYNGKTTLFTNCYDCRKSYVEKNKDKNKNSIPEGLKKCPTCKELRMDFEFKKMYAENVKVYVSCFRCRRAYFEKKNKIKKDEDGVIL